MQAVTTIGLDIAKSVFQVDGIDAEGQVIIRRQLSWRRAWSGSRPALRRIVGRANCRPGTYGTADAAGLCETLREAAEERCCRC